MNNLDLLRDWDFIWSKLSSLVTTKTVPSPFTSDLTVSAPDTINVSGDVSSALSKAKQALIDSTLTVKMAPGTYLPFEVSGVNLGVSGQFVMDGFDSAVGVSGAVTGTSSGGTSPTVLQFVSGGWTLNQLVGSYLSVGSEARPILANTATSITVTSIPGMTSGQVFAVVQPRAIVGGTVGVKSKNNVGAITLRGITFTSTDICIQAFGGVILDGCTIVNTDLTSLQCYGGDVVVKNCVFASQADALISACGSVALSAISSLGAGTITVRDCNTGTAQITATSAVSNVLRVERAGYFGAEITANGGAATPVYLESVGAFEAIGGKMTGAGNTGYGVELQKNGRYTLTGSTITGSLGDVNFLGNVVPWATLSSPSFGVVEEHASSAVANSGYTKSLVYGNRTYMGNMDVSGRLLLYGYLNVSSNLTIPTLTGTQTLDMEAGTIDGVPTIESARGAVEMISSSASSKVVLPSGAVIAGVLVGVVNRGASATTILPPSGGTINGVASVTCPANTAKLFISLNGAGGKNYWTLV